MQQLKGCVTDGSYIPGIMVVQDDFGKSFNYVGILCSIMHSWLPKVAKYTTVATMYMLLVW